MAVSWIDHLGVQRTPLVIKIGSGLSLSLVEYSVYDLEVIGGSGGGAVCAFCDGCDGCDIEGCQACDLEFGSYSETQTVYDPPTDTIATMGAGFTGFSSGGPWGSGGSGSDSDEDLKFKLVYDSSNPSNNGLWTTLAISQEEITGIALDTPLDVVSGDEMYVVVHNRRRMKIDLGSAQEFRFTSIRHTTEELTSDHFAIPIYCYDWETVFFVFDPSLGQYEGVMMLDYNGVLWTKIPIRQVVDIGDIP